MTYLIASLETGALDAGLLVSNDADSRGVHVAEDILDFTDEDLIFGVDLTGKEGDLGLVNEGDNLVFTNVREISDFLHVRGRTLVEATTTTTESSTATSTASVSSTASTESATSSITTASEATSLHSYLF
jgi:hypothetical protein